MFKKTYNINWDILDSENWSKIEEQLPKRVVANSFNEAVEIANSFQNTVSGCTFTGIVENIKIYIKVNDERE